jgi:hypothetical protein
MRWRKARTAEEAAADLQLDPSTPDLVDEQPEPVQSPASDPVAAVTIRSDVRYTGHQRIDDALAELAEVAGAAPADQIPALTQAHAVLVETLDSIGSI